jgi:hypothetical protein
MKRVATGRGFHLRAIVHHVLQADQTLATQHPQQLREQLIESLFVLDAESAKLW